MAANTSNSSRSGKAGDLVTGEFRFVNAGHEIPFICKKNGVFEPYKIRAGFVLAGICAMFSLLSLIFFTSHTNLSSVSYIRNRAW